MNVIAAGDVAYPYDCSNYAAEAIRLDSMGRAGSAIIFYERVRYVTYKKNRVVPAGTLLRMARYIFTVADVIW